MNFYKKLVKRIGLDMFDFGKSGYLDRYASPTAAIGRFRSSETSFYNAQSIGNVWQLFTSRFLDELKWVDQMIPAEERAQSLYYYKQALRYKRPDMARKHLQKYYDLTTAVKCKNYRFWLPLQLAFESLNAIIACCFPFIAF